VGSEGISVVEKEGDDMLTHPHKKVSKLHSKESHHQPIFKGFSDVFFQYLLQGLAFFLRIL
jgi:hypothetical protein